MHQSGHTTLVCSMTPSYFQEDTLSQGFSFFFASTKHTLDCRRKSGTIQVQDWVHGLHFHYGNLEGYDIARGQSILRITLI